MEDQIVQAREQQVDLLAPAAFAQLAKLYSQVDAARRKGAPPAQLSAGIKQTLGALERAAAIAAKVRGALAGTLDLRRQMERLDETRLGPGDEFLRRAAARSEAGDAEGAAQLASSAEVEYGRAAADSLRSTRLREAAAALEAARAGAPPEFVQRAEAQYKATAELLDTPGLRDIRTMEVRLSDLIAFLLPEFYRNPPMTLTIDGFTILVEAYTARQWDFRSSRMVHVNGTGWISFDCRPIIAQVYPNITTVLKNMSVVEAVKDPLREIALEDARIIEPQASVGAVVQLNLPTYAVTALQVSQAIRDIQKIWPRRQGDIKVHFDDLTILAGPRPQTGIVVNGTAGYPTPRPDPDPLSLPVAGFRVEVSHLEINVKGAIATGFLEFPNSIIDPGTGHPGRVPLAKLAINKQCEFRQQLSTAFGPWVVGNTEMVIQGNGVIADFDPNWAPPGINPASPAAQAAWRGAILGSGTTVPASGQVVSNSGYFRAAYSFSNVEVTAPGLSGHFDLTSPFEFIALQPLRYIVQFSGGSLDLQASALAQGVMLQGQITAPADAAQSGSGAPLRAAFKILSMDDGLHVVGAADITDAIRWGEYTQTPNRPTFYEARTMARGTFYLSGAYRPNYFPIGPTGDFVPPTALFGDPRIDGMQGLTAHMPRELTVYTTDTPKAAKLDFRVTAKPRIELNFINISFGGVHAQLNDYATQQGSNKDLGPTQDSFYVGVEPFHPASTAMPGGGPVISDYLLDASFVSSAVYDCDMRGKFHIPAPADSDLEFEKAAFTSTAQISGAKAPFNNPFQLSYWGLDMVKKPGASAGAVISVRTGQVFFTAAGIRETRHFAQPFYLTWGEMLANGTIRRLVFDYAGVGQKFDLFPFTTSFVRLSDYVAGTPAYLKVAGTVHFDVFGAKYINVNDYYDPLRPGDPYNSRRLDNLMTDSDPGGAFRVSDRKLAGNWSSDFGSMNFDYDYDRNAQDGFLGKGQMGFKWVSGTMSSSIVIKSARMCMSVYETERRDFTLGPVAHFGAMNRTTGCGCIESGQLKRIMLSAELEAAADANLVLRSAAYGRVEWSLTPSVSTLEIAGDMYLNILAGVADVQVTGLASFTVNRDLGYVEGLVNGKFSSASALGMNSLSADGQVNWHLGTLGAGGYQSLQGRLAVQVISPMGGAGVEGGLYLGINAPKSEAWVLSGADSRFRINMAPLPANLTGLYGYVKWSESLNLWIISGGMETYVGVGGFVNVVGPVGSGVGIPYAIGHGGWHIWGDILGGLVGVGGTVNLEVVSPWPFSFAGTLTLEGCVLWVICGSVDIGVGLNSTEGFYIR